MAKTVEEILNVLYPNLDSLSEEQNKQYLKDEKFLTEYIEQFNEVYATYEEQIDKWGEHDFTTAILEMAKERFDKEFIIGKKVSSVLYGLDRDSYVSNNFEEFLKIMREEKRQEELAKDVELDTTAIDIEAVFSLTEELLIRIDPTGELINEFDNLRHNGKILIFSPEDNEKSVYKDGCINFVFDGTVNTAHTLLHEFMHHYIEIKSSPTNSREDHTLLNEYISIYYENAFIKLMADRGIVKDERPLISKRLSREYSKDADSSSLILLELSKILKDKGSLDKDAIMSIAKQYFPEITDEEELWEKIYEVVDNSFFHSGEFIAKIMYKFNTVLALNTPHNSQTEESIFKLADLVVDRQHDHIFMERLNSMLERDKISDRIPLSSCHKVREESDIPGNFTSVEGEYFVPSENRTGFYKLNVSCGNNPDLRELLSSIILKAIGVPVADIILVKDDKTNENGCISMNILQEGERFLKADDYDLTFDISRSLPQDISGLDRFITTDLQYHARKFNFPPEALEYRRKFLIQYVFVSALLGNDDIKTDNCQVVYNENNGTIRNPEYYDMGISFVGPATYPNAEYQRYFFDNQTDMDVLKELYSKYPEEIADISIRVSQNLDRDYLTNLLNQNVFSDMSPEVLQNIWAHMGSKISYITRQNELLYGQTYENNSFVTSMDEVEEVARGQKISIIDKAKRFFTSLKEKILGDGQK